MPTSSPYLRAYLSRLYEPAGTPDAYTPKTSGSSWFGSEDAARRKIEDDLGGDGGLGLGTLISEIGQGVSGLVSVFTPVAGPGPTDLLKGLGSSMGGTALNLLIPGERGDLGIKDAARQKIGQAVGTTPEEEEAFTPVSIKQQYQERGLLPMLAENVGNVALASSVPTGAVRGASAAARVAGAKSMAARLAATHEGLISRPLIQASQHPYRTAGRALREGVTQPALSRKLAAAGIDDTPLEEAPIDFLAAELPDTGVDYRQVQTDMERLGRTAEAYRNMPDSDPQAQAAYDAFNAEIDEQYRHLTEDLGVTVEVLDDADPYPSKAEMAADLRDNKRLQIRGAGQDSTHPFMSLEQTNKFRAVHDAYGHAATGRGFSRHGEEAAFLAHSSMLGPEAQRALATETRGQTSVLIDEGTFPSNKGALLPEDLSDPSGSMAAHQKTPPAPVGKGTEFLAGIEERLLAHDAAVEARRQTTLADAERRVAMRSPATLAAVNAATEHLMDAGKAAGLDLTRQEASLIVGSEKRARMTGYKALEEDALVRGIPEDVVARATGRQRWIPEALRTDPDLEAAITKAVDTEIVQRDAVRRTLESGRRGSEGLEPTDAMEPTLTKKQKKSLKQAEKRLARAHSDVLRRKAVRERTSREKHLDALVAKRDRIGAMADDIAAKKADALAEFEHSRSWTPKAWRGKGAMEATAQAIHAQTLANVAEHGGEWGGASFNPHTGRFIEGGKDTGFAVSLVKDTALEVPLDEFTPQHLEQVIRAYQDVYQHPNTVVGTWVEDGLVYIDPSEIVPTIDDAIIRGAARRQLSTYDIAADNVVPGILKDRPDIAAPFINRHRNLSARTGELRRIAKRASFTENDVTVMMDLLMRQAVRAHERGLVSHPDEFFRKHVSKFEFATKRTTRPGALGQIVLERAIGTPEEKAALWKEMTRNVRDVGKVRAWYFESHDLVERLFRNQADVTLLDGSKINPADLMYQIVAITSFQAMPRDNWTRAMTAFQRFDDLPRGEMKAYTAALKKVVAGKATLEEAFGLGGKDLADRFAGFALYPEPRQYLAEILSGRTIDQWTPEYLAEASAGFGKKTKNLDRQKALAHIEAEHPDVIERIGEDAAVKEFWGRQHRAKIITFWDNLQDPERSLGVTMDQQMERLFGEGMPESGGGDSWLKYSEQIRDMADELSEVLGERIMPHELQAVMWVFAKEEVTRLQQGHFNALAQDATDLVRDGVQITDNADPILQWIDEASEPYVTEGQRHVRQHRILRDETEPPKTKPPISHTQSPLDYGTGQPVLRMEVRDPNAGPSKSLTYFDDPNRIAFIDYSPNLRRPGEVYIHFMSTRPESRGQGLSRALTEELYRITGDEQIDYGDIEAPEVEVLRRKMAEAYPEKGNYGKPAPSIPDEADAHLKAAGRKGESVEDVIYRPGWGAKNREGKVDLFAKRKVQWLTERAEINASLAVGDLDTAQARLSKYVTHMQTKAPRSLGLADDAAGASFFDIWMKGEFHSAGYRAAADALERLDTAPGDLPPLMQSFRDKILGEFVPMDDGTRGVIRIFEDGNLATLVHENGHLLRRILDDSEARAVEGAYGLQGRRWTVEAEERFADDLLAYMNSGKAPAGLQTAFARVREVLGEMWEMVRSTFQGRRVHPELADIFEDWLTPGVTHGPDVPGEIAGLPARIEAGTPSQRAARPPRLPEPPAKKGDYYAAGRKGAEALARVEKLAARQRSLAASAAHVEEQMAAVRKVLAEGRLPSNLERNALVAEATAITDKVNEQLGTSSVTRSPARWQPLLMAAEGLAREAKANPGMADLFDGLPETLAEIQHYADEHGVNPVHVSEMSPAKVRRLVFGTMRLGVTKDDVMHEAVAGTRKKRTGALARVGSLDHSVEGFVASVVEATQEKRTNMVIDKIEGSVARRVAAGGEIPAGWQAWDPVRTYLLTGQEISPTTGKILTTASKDTMIVPDSVVRSLNRFTKDYDHWAWSAISKVTSPWRTLVLTLSPGWYVRNVVGNVILAEAEGVSLKDWHAAWKSARTKDTIGRFADMPWVTSDTLAQEAGIMADDSLVPRRSFGEAVQEGGRLRGAAQYAARHLLRVNEVVDEFARAAVYHRGRRLNMTHEQAWSRAKAALVDYNNLSGFERTAVRSVIPFYAWQKGILKVTLNQALDHPARASTLMLLGRLQEEYIADRFGVDPGDVPDYYKHIIGGRNLRSFNPFADPSEVVTPEGITRSMNPFLELGIRKGLGAPEFYSDDRRLGFFGQAQQDFSVPAALGEMVTRSPGGKILGEGPGLGMLGIPAEVDEDVLRSRFLKARRLIRGVPNPESGQAASGWYGGG